MHAVKRKKTLAYLENCSASARHQSKAVSLVERSGGKARGRHAPMRNLGMKVTMLYLLVETELPGHFCGALSVGLLRWTTRSPS